MICPICEQDLEIIEREVDIFADDFSGIAKYAVCRDCRKQWKLKNTTATNKKKNPSAEENRSQISVVGEDKQTTPPDLASLVNAAKAGQLAPPEDKLSDEERGWEPKNARVAEDDYRNLAKSADRSNSDKPPGRRSKSAPLNKEARPSNKQRRPSRDSGEQPREKKRRPSRVKEDKPKVQPRHPSRAREGKIKDKPEPPSLVRGAASKGKQRPPSRTEVKGAPKRNEDQGLEVPFKLVRIGLAILSVLAFLYLSAQGYLTYYLDYVRFRGAIPISITVAVFVLGLSCLIAGIFLIVTLKKEGILPFIVPSFLYLVGGVIAFFFREDSRLLLSGAIIALIVAIVLIILVLIDKIKNVEE